MPTPRKATPSNGRRESAGGSPNAKRRARPRGDKAATSQAAAAETPLRVVFTDVTGTVRGDRVPGPPPPRTEPTDATESRGRRGELLLAAIAIFLVGAVALAMLLGGRDRSPGEVAVATPSAAAAALPAETTASTRAATPSSAPAPSPAATAPVATPAPPPSTTPPKAQPTEPSTPVLSAPARAVAAFYDAVARHDWDRAIDLWSPSMQQRYPPDEWLIDRFRPTTRIDIMRLRTAFIDHDAGIARVNVSLVEYRRTGPSPRTFVGSWDLVRIHGAWKLNDPNF